jgi:TetR/AcrR family transcriptional repressor of nem operon
MTAGLFIIEQSFNNEMEPPTKICSNVPMGRPPKFDRETVLDCAMRCFWKRGYAQTSIDDLVEATGLKRGSLYFYFEDKKTLFLAVLDHYKRNVVLKRRAQVDSAPNARAGIEAFFAETLRSVEGADFYWGCLNTNTATQLSEISEQEIRDWIGNGITAWELYWAQVINRGIQDGSLSPRGDPRDVAIALVALTQGSNVVLRSLNSSFASRRAIQTVLEGILGIPRNKRASSRSD